MTEGNGQSFSVDMSQQTKIHLKELHQKALQSGMGTHFVTAFRQILGHLRQNPCEFGEPLYSLAALKLQVRKGAIAPLVVTYGVHDEKPLVFIQGSSRSSDRSGIRHLVHN
jgi:hypothetical protein